MTVTSRSVESGTLIFKHTSAAPSLSPTTTFSVEKNISGMTVKGMIYILQHVHSVGEPHFVYL